MTEQKIVMSPADVLTLTVAEPSVLTISSTSSRRPFSKKRRDTINALRKRLQEQYSELAMWRAQNDG